VELTTLLKIAAFRIFEYLRAHSDTPSGELHGVGYPE